jgi:DNA-directed RNA polymerase specialized sigma24 family protein
MHLLQAPFPDEYANKYVTKDDFGRLFTENMDSLYFLAFLLTSDHEKAEQCFIAGLEDSLRSSHVFAGWAHLWAKQAVIKNAVDLVQPHPASGELALADASALEASLLSIQNAYFEVGDVVALEPFARFVFVLSVLEQYSQRECALLLGSSVREVRKVRVQAIGQVLNSLDTVPMRTRAV